MKKAIVNAKIFTGEKFLENSAILLEDGKITAVQEMIPEEYAERIDLKGQYIAPGLIDMQINGGETRYFSQYPDEKTLLDMEQVCRRFGTLDFLPTLISSRMPKILKAIEVIRGFMRKYPDSGVLGLHLEGPFINPCKRGTHNRDAVRRATDGEIEEIATYGSDVIKVMTIAPEMLTDHQIEILHENGIRLSIGHSDISYETAQKCFKNGIRLVTHLFNAMSDFSHRSPGLVGAALDNDEVYTPLILDGHHSYFAADRIAYRCKRDKLVLTTDAVFIGHKIKTFKWQDFEAKLENNSFVNSEGKLAGSAISMADAVQNAIDHLHVSLQEAIEMATGRVATALGMQDKIGFIKEGYPARFFVFKEKPSEGEPLLFNADDNYL